VKNARVAGREATNRKYGARQGAKKERRLDFLVVRAIVPRIRAGHGARFLHANASVASRGGRDGSDTVDVSRIVRARKRGEGATRLGVIDRLLADQIKGGAAREFAKRQEDLEAEQQQDHSQDDAQDGATTVVEQDAADVGRVLGPDSKRGILCRPDAQSSRRSSQSSWPAA